MDALLGLVVVFSSITIWKVAPLWFRHRQELEREKLALSKKNPQEEGEAKKLKERMENLEALVCRLDSEINAQFERSYTLFNRVTSTAPQDMSQMPTTFLNIASALESRYQVLKELGRGGMGIVFQAQDKQLNEQVAIKILSPLLSNDPEALERLKREVSAARRVTHGNVIRIHDISELNGLHFVSMEFFQGTSLVRQHARF